MKSHGTVSWSMWGRVVGASEAEGSVRFGEVVHVLGKFHSNTPALRSLASKSCASSRVAPEHRNLGARE